MLRTLAVRSALFSGLLTACMSAPTWSAPVAEPASALVEADPAASGRGTNAKREDAGARAISKAVDQAAGRLFKESAEAVGMAIGIVKDGKTYTYTYGTVARRVKRAPTADTRYLIASITKTFTGTLLAQAALEKKVALDDDIRKYLDGEFPNLEFQGHPIRLQDLLDHRSGLPLSLPETNENSLAVLAQLKRNYSRRDFYNDLHKIKLTAIPGGETTQYSNAAVQLASFILERIYGMPYETLLKTRILTPLGMDATCLSASCSPTANVAVGYVGKDKPAPDDSTPLEAAGALKSTLNDMLKYARWQLEEKDPAVKLTHQPLFTSGDYSAGLNWQIMRSNEKRIIWQSGNFPGFHSLCVSLMSSKIAVVVLSNDMETGMSNRRHLMVNEILKQLDPGAVPLP